MIWKDIKYGKTKIDKVYSGTTLIYDGTPYLCFTADENNCSIQLTNIGGAYSIDLSISTNKLDWRPYQFDSNGEGEIITLSLKNDELFWKESTSSSNPNKGKFSNSPSKYFIFKLNGKIKASGNILSLVDETCQTKKTSRFDNLFSGCTSLLTPPDLPATELTINCYRNMFNSCSSLTYAPTLPAKTLAQSCYYRMFLNCTNLSQIEVGFTEWSSESNCYSDWLKGTNNTGTFICPSTLTSEYGDNRIPSNWTIVKT